MDLFLDILLDTTIDTVKLIPFLFLTYLAMEYLENRAGEKTVSILHNAGKKGPLIGGILGVFPQCGFSAAASNLYSGGVITVGTLLAVFLSTSDEMIPVLISEQVRAETILIILGAKVVVGVTAGIVVDIMISLTGRGSQKGLHIHGLCERDNCHCEERSILSSAVVHSIEIIIFIFLISFILNMVVEFVGMEELVGAVSRYPVFSIFVTGLIGLIPNCASSVTITKLYLEGVLSAGCMFAGLLSCAGIGLLVLFKTNRDWKKNLMILATLYGISVAGGIAAQILL